MSKSKRRVSCKRCNSNLSTNRIQPQELTGIDKQNELLLGCLICSRRYILRVTHDATNFELTQVY